MNIEGKVFLAPLAGITDNVFRLICYEMGADICISEMVSSAGLHYKPEKSLPLAELRPEEKNTGIQIFGSDPVLMGEAAARLSVLNPYFIDINMGCSVKKVNKAGAGSVLLGKPDRIREIINSMTNSASVPVTAKIRLGIDRDDSANILNALMDTDAAFITVHGRTAKQGFRGTADWDAIKKLKRLCDRPIIGNGDLDSAEKALEMWKYAGTDAIMIGRAVLGYPWIFREVKAVMAGRQYSRPDRDEVVDMLTRHYSEEISQSDDKTAAVKRMRKHFHWYTKGFSGIREMRDRINKALTEDEAFSIIDELRSRDYENRI